MSSALQSYKLIHKSFENNLDSYLTKNGFFLLCSFSPPDVNFVHSLNLDLN